MIFGKAIQTVVLIRIIDHKVKSLTTIAFSLCLVWIEVAFFYTLIL